MVLKFYAMYCDTITIALRCYITTLYYHIILSYNTYIQINILKIIYKHSINVSCMSLSFQQTCMQMPTYQSTNVHMLQVYYTS